MRVAFYFFGELLSEDMEYFRIGAEIGEDDIFVGITFSPDTWTDKLGDLKNWVRGLLRKG